MASFESSASLSNLAELQIPTGGVEDNDQDEELDQSGSPRRRSTRVSAMRAAEKMKEDNPSEAAEMTLQQLDAANGDDTKPPGKKRRLAKYCGLDQWDPHFAIQLDSHDDAVILSDDSVVSSLSENEADNIRKTYEKAAAKDLTPEQRLERQLMIKQLESELRLEEARLLMLKKLRMSQQMPSGARDSNRTHNSTTTSNASAATNNGHLANSNNRGQQQSSHFNRQNTPNNRNVPNNNNNANSNVNNSGGAMNLSNSTANRNTVVNQHSNRMNSSSNNQQVPSAHQSSRNTHNQTSTPPTNNNLNNIRQQNRTASPAQPPQMDAAQKQMAVKLALRKQLEKTLLQIPAPKPPTEEQIFVPNLNQGEFLFYVGLDMAVQKVLKDKSYTDPRCPKPWTCHQCSTDFTPYWKCVKVDPEGADEQSNWRLLCEHCVRSNQKKAVEVEHKARLKQAFVKALQQEKEIEQQINDGKFDWASIGLQPPVVHSTNSNTSSNVTSNSNTANTPNTISNSNNQVHNLQQRNHHTATPPSAHNNRASQQSQSQRSGGGSSANMNNNNNTNNNSNNNNNNASSLHKQQQQQLAGIQAQAQAAAALIMGQQQGHNRQQQQLNAAAAAMQFNPLAMGAWNPQLASRFPHMAMNALAAQAAQAQQAMQQQQPAAAVQQQFQQLLNMGPDAQRLLLRQLQQQQQAMAQMQRHMPGGSGNSSSRK